VLEIYYNYLCSTYQHNIMNLNKTQENSMKDKYRWMMMMNMLSEMMNHTYQSMEYKKYLENRSIIERTFA
jgi:hypothetical protein